MNGFRFSDSDNKVPYWKDVGTLDNYYNANMDALKANAAIDVSDPLWGISSAPNSLPPTRFCTDKSASAFVAGSLLGHGCEIHACEISGSVVCEKVHVAKHAVIKDSVVMPNARIEKGAKVFNAIVDAACHIPAGIEIGFSAKVDIQHGFRVSENGGTLVSQDALVKLKQRLVNQNKDTVLTELTQSHPTQYVKNDHAYLSEA